jgi:hypothetical protein
VEARLNKDKTNTELARQRLAEKKKTKGKSALEQASEENRGWRDADATRDMQAYN